MTTELDFPSSLPCAIVDGYGYQRKDIVVRTELDTGRTRMRQRFSDGPATVSVQWVMKGWHFAYFEGWFLHTIEAGALPFNINLNVGSGYQPHECRFLAPYAMEGLASGDVYRVSAQLEARVLQIWPAGIIDIIAAYEAGGLTALDFFAFLDLFEIYVNIDLPDSEMVPGGLG